jgi:5-formyltetrahydrofolate cyclo-ligase
MPAESDPATAKASLRDAALGRRNVMAPEDRAAASQTIAALALPLAMTAVAEGFAPVSAYWPIRSEVDTRPILAELAATGIGLSLPAVTPAGLVFRRWQPGDPLRARGFGLSEPEEIAEAVRPRLILVPLAAFDRRLNRIGYGMGHYDRALAALAGVQTLRIYGLAFACQEVAHIPAEPHDWRLDAIVTEAGLVR